MMDCKVDYSLLEDLKKAITGEYEAICCYEVLACQAPTEKIKKQILEIRNDEIKHYQTFSHIYFCLTGYYYCPEKPIKCPKTYIEGINVAFHDEQETVDFYNNVARRVHDPYIQHSFAQAALDEQNHAVWFLYFMQMQLICHK